MVGKVFPTKTDIAKKLVGTYVAEDSAHHLSLISLINDESKSTILTGLIDDYLATQSSVSSLIKTAALRVIQNWQANGWRGKRTTAAFNTYLESTKKDLIRHRISPDMIELIIMEIKNNG